MPSEPRGLQEIDLAHRTDRLPPLTTSIGLPQTTLPAGLPRVGENGEDEVYANIRPTPCQAYHRPPHALALKGRAAGRPAIRPRLTPGRSWVPTGTSPEERRAAIFLLGRTGPNTSER